MPSNSITATLNTWVKACTTSTETDATIGMETAFLWATTSADSAPTVVGTHAEKFGRDAWFTVSLKLVAADGENYLWMKAIERTEDATVTKPTGT